MNLTIESAQQKWRQIKPLQAFQATAVVAVLATTALLAGGVIEDKAPASSAPTIITTQEGPAGDMPSPEVKPAARENNTPALVYYLVNTQAESLLLQSALSGEQASSGTNVVYEVIAADTPLGMTAADIMASAAWAAEFGEAVQVIELR